MKRRLVKMGKAKIGEKNKHTESADVEPFEETPPHSSDSSNQSLDDLITLSDLVQSNKARRLAITTYTGQANSKQLKQGLDNEKTLEEDCEEFTSPILVKTEEKDSNHSIHTFTFTYSFPPFARVDKARKKQFTKKSLRYIVLDENSFEEELNIGKELVQQQSPTKDVGKEISKLKRSTRGRVIRPKKYN